MDRQQPGGDQPPKIVELLDQPGAQHLRELIATARRLGVGPTIYAGYRLPRTTFLYDDPEHPDRPTGTVASPPFTEEDHALLVGLDLWERQLCSGCGHPRKEAWHSDQDGWYEADRYVCYACSAAREDGKETSHTVVRNTRPPGKPLPPFRLGETTTSP